MALKDRIPTDVEHLAMILPSVLDTVMPFSVEVSLETCPCGNHAVMILTPLGGPNAGTFIKLPVRVKQLEPLTEGVYLEIMKEVNSFIDFAQMHEGLHMLHHLGDPNHPCLIHYNNYEPGPETPEA
jgi:hypothetical protein